MPPRAGDSLSWLMATKGTPPAPASSEGGSARSIPLMASRCDADPSLVEDLAHRRPGDAVLEQARLAREAAPVRSVLARLLRVHTAERAWRLGAVGEVLV